MLHCVYHLRTWSQVKKCDVFKLPLSWNRWSCCFSNFVRMTQLCITIIYKCCYLLRELLDVTVTNLYYPLVYSVSTNIQFFADCCVHVRFLGLRKIEIELSAWGDIIWIVIHRGRCKILLLRNSRWRYQPQPFCISFFLQKFKRDVNWRNAGRSFLLFIRIKQICLQFFTVHFFNSIIDKHQHMHLTFNSILV